MSGAFFLAFFGSISKCFSLGFSLRLVLLISWVYRPRWSDCLKNMNFRDFAVFFIYLIPNKDFLTSLFSYRFIVWMNNSLFCRQSSIKNRSDCHIYYFIMAVYFTFDMDANYKLCFHRIFFSQCVRFWISCRWFFMPIFFLLFIMRIYMLAIDTDPIGQRPATCKSIVCPSILKKADARVRCVTDHNLYRNR